MNAPSPRPAAACAVDALTDFIVNLAARVEAPGFLSEATIGEIDGLLNAAFAEVRNESTAELDRAREDLAFLHRTTLPDLRREVERHKDGKQRWRERAEKAEARVAELIPERNALQQRLHDAALTKVWVNEDGKRFVFLEDIAPALFGIGPKAGEQR